MEYHEPQVAKSVGSESLSAEVSAARNIERIASTVLDRVAQIENILFGQLDAREINKADSSEPPTTPCVPELREAHTAAATHLKKAVERLDCLRDKL